MISLTSKNTAINWKTIFTKKAFLMASGILLAVLIAAIFGNYVAMLATRQIDDNITRFIVGIVIGFLVGIGVGVLVAKSWNGLQKHLMR